MPRFRNEEPDQSHYVDGDVVWVKIHNTEIWWPGEVTSSQDFRFVNSTRPPFAVVAFFNEKTFEQVKSAKLIYPFQCANKEEFIRLGTSKYKKSDGHNMGDKFSEDVAIAEARFLGSAHQQLSSLHSASSCSSSSRPDSLIKALLSSSTSSSLRNSSTRSSSGVPSPAGNRPESVFRIMDIGGTPKHSSHRKRRVDETYDCHMCSFRTTSMDVLLIHRRGHVETSSNYSSNSTANSTTNSSISLHRCPKTRAARRANTTNNAFDLRHLSQRRSGDSTHFLPNSVRCHSRHVSIVVDASLTDEEQQRVASIAQQTMECIERVVHPSGTSSSASASTSSLGHSRHRRRSIRNSCSSSQPQETPRRSTQHQHPRDPRSHRSNQLRATMPAPQPPTQPSKQRRLTRSMSRLQQGVSPPQSPAELPPPSTSRRGGGRRRTLAVSATPSERPAASVSRRSNPMRKTLAAVADPTETPVSSGRRKRTLQRNIMPRTPTPEPPAAPAPAPEEEEDVGAEPVPEEPPTPKKSRQAEPPPPTEQQNNYAGSLELQRSLMAEWCDDEMEELPPEQEQEQEPEQEQEIEPIQHSTPNGREDEEEPKQPEDDEDMMLADRLPAKKRIRNIPKKDRRDAVRQDFDVEEHDEPIVIPDSDASSNESVVFVDDEPRQRRKRHAAGHGHGHASSNGNDKSKSTSATTTASKSCFDFEEEDDLQQQQQQEGQNGLSYRRRTCTNRLDINGKGHSEVAVAVESEEVTAKLKISAPGEHFMGFDEARQEVAAAEIEPQEEPEPEPKPAEMDAETQTEPEVEAEEAEPEPEPEVEGEAGDHLSLPIKERQKRIFKSRNKSTVAASMAVQEEVRDTVDQDQQQEQEQGLPTNGNGAAAELELFNDEEESLKESSESGSRSKGSGKRRDRTKTDSSSSRRQKRRSKAKAARLQSRSPPTPVPVPEELSNNSTNTTSSSSSSSSSTSSSSSSSSNHISRPSSSMLSPGHSSSNSCSIASNIAVISPEEARELQRSASGAGMMHAAIVDATQPVQRGGVLILEDIRLPNLYEPFGSMSSPSVSNDSSSRRPISRVERDEEDDDDRSQDSRASVSEQQTVEEESREREEDREEEEESQKDDDDEAEADFDADADEENREAASLLNESEIEPEVVAPSPEPIPLPDIAPSPVVAPEPASDLEALPVIPASASDLAPEPPGPEPREIILKKREQELLRQYKADLVSGRTAEKCRKARERWSRPARSTEEDDPQDLLELELQLELDAESSQAIEDDQYEQEQGNREMLDHEVEQQQQEESTDSLDAELAEIQLVLPASVYQRPYRRAVSHPNAANAVAVNANARKASEYVGCPQALCDADVAKAHQQLVDLREQQRRRYSPSEAAAPEPRRQRRRSRNPASNGGELRFDVPDEAGEPKEVQESLTPHLYAGRICAVMTRPIPGYSHTFMLCSLSNNNFTPINNVALYLDSEKNHLVPVPREALLEPPRLADGHPLSAVFADIDILGGEAVAQVMEPYEAVAEPEPEPDLVQEQGEMQSPSQMPSSSQSQSQSQSQNQLQSPSQSQSQMPSPSQMQSRSQSQNPRPSLVGNPQRMATVQILLSDSEHGDDGDEERPTVEALGIMTPLSQVTDGGNAANAALPVAATSYVNAEDQQLSLHEENAADGDGNGDEEEEEQVDPNVLQLNVHGHRLELDPSMLFSIAEQPDSCVELSVAETSPTTGICSVGNTTAVLLARDILRAAQIYLQERDLQLVNVEDMTLDGEEALAVPVTDLLSQALAGSEVVDDADFVDATNAGVGMLHIDTRAAGGTAGGPAGGTGLQHHSVGAVVEPGVSVVYLSHALPPAAAHLTPPITARTNETNALLDQTPIMSTLENPSGGLHLRRVSPLTEGNLEDSLAVIGVTNSVSGVPTSLELPITVTNPAIAPRMTAPAPIVDLVQFAPFQ